MNTQLSALSTAVGSMPHRDAARAVELVLEAFPRLPSWPQLPGRSFNENMYVQCSEGLPCMVVDREKETVCMDISGNVIPAMEDFYGRVLEGDLDSFAISEEYAAGFHRFVEVLGARSGRGTRVKGVKGQITGPISFGLSVGDQRRQVIINNEDIMDAVVKTIAMKAAWQVRELKKLSPRVMIWLMEPHLASFGSACFNLPVSRIHDYIEEVVEGIHDAGALAGIHCCGNTDWSLLMDIGLDIISFDAYGYFTGITLYPKELARFFNEGGMLAIGLIPASPGIEEEDEESLGEVLTRSLRALSGKLGMIPEEVWKRCILSPSCGLEKLSEEHAERVLELASRVKPDM